VYVRDFRPAVDPDDPRCTYPYLAAGARKYFVPIYPEYHTELLPDSILNTESPKNFVENKPNRNALSKVYISRSYERGMKPGDVIVFYRTASGGAGWYTSVATTIGVVQEVITDIPNFEAFRAVCRKRSVFTDEKLKEYWDWSPGNRPFVVNFLFVYSVPKRPTLQTMSENDIMKTAPRGFELIKNEAFDRLLQVSNADARFIVR